METKLVSIGEIITKGWDLFSKNYPKFIVPILIILISNVLYYLAMFYAGPNILLLLVLTALIIFIGNWISIVLILIANAIYLEQPVDINKILEQSFAKLPSYLLVVILTGLAVFGGLILLIIPGIIFAVWFTFSGYINLLEDKENKSIAALKSSKALVTGRWLDVFNRLIMPILIVYIALIIVSLIIGIIINVLTPFLSEFKKELIIKIISSSLSYISLPLMVIFELILYNSLKATKSVITNSQTTPSI